MANSELDALRAVAEALDQLEEDEVRRVLQWAASKYVADPAGATTGLDALVVASAAPDEGSADLGQTAIPDPEDLAELFHQADPSTEREKVLVAAYWLTIDEPKRDFSAFDVNAELKSLGHPIGNITREFDRLMGTKPQLIMLARKTGTSRQARKHYRVTTSGRAYVEGLVQENHKV